MEVLTFWRVAEWDGGERTINTKFAFTNEDACGEYKKKNPHNTLWKEELVLCDTMADFNDMKTGELRKRALGKLTAQERVALGFPAEI